MTLTRRETLRKTAIASGGIVAGGAAVSGIVAGSRGGPGFVPRPSDFDEGETFTVDVRLESLELDSLECEARGGRTFTAYSVVGSGFLSSVLWTIGDDPLKTGDAFEIVKVRKCGKLTFTGSEGTFSHEADKIIYKPVKQ